MDKKNNEEKNIMNDKGAIPETKVSTMNEKNQINFQNNNILINIENLSLINPGKEKIKIVNSTNANNNNNKEDEKNKNKNNASSGILEEKLETIFLEREKAKLKYNKQVLPDTLKYFSSSDEESNFSIDNKNKKNEKKVSDNNANKTKDDKKKDSPKKDNKEINEIKSFTRKRFNKANNIEEKQDKNMYQILLSKKIKNFMVDIDDEDNNKNESNHGKDEEKKNDIEKKVEIKTKENIMNDKAEKQNLNSVIDQKQDNQKELEKNKKDNEKEEKEKKEENKKEKEEKEKEEKLNENNSKIKNEENAFKQISEPEKNIENKNDGSNKEEDEQHSPTFCSKNHKENILNQNLKDGKNNQLLNAEKNLNLIDSIIRKKENKENNNNNIDNSNEKKNLAFKHKIDLKNINEKLKTFNKNNNLSEINEEKEKKEEPKEKSNIMDLLKRIKNKKSEREQIDKEAEKAKEEMYKRPKSQVGTRNIDSFRKLKSHSKEENEINIEVSNNTRNKKTPLGSPKPEIYNRKAMNDSINKNIFYTSNKTNENYKTQNQSPKSVDLVKDNSELSSNSKINRIIVNPRIKRKIFEKKTINNFKKIDLKTNENPKNLSNIYSATYINRINKSKNLNQINCKKTYERPIFIYNKHKLQNRSLYTDTNESYNFLSTNILKNNSKNKIIRINLPNNIYNPRKPQTEKINSMDKFKREKNNLMTSDYCGYNFTNYNDISQSNIYSKKKSILLDNNNEGNKSSYHISKSNKYNNLNNYKINSSGVSPSFSSQYSMLQKNTNNINKEINLKVNRKSFYKTKRQKSTNESSDLGHINIRNFVSDNFNKNYANDKSLDKYDSFLNKRNATIKSYKNNANNKISNSNQHSRKSGLQKFARTKKEILFSFNDEYEENQSLKKKYNKNKFIKKMTINNSEEIFNTRKVKNAQKKLNLFKLEDLLIFEEKLNNILECLKNIKEANKQCFDLWNFFFNSSIIKKIERIFDDEKEMNIAKYSINYQLISIIVCYEYCIDQDAYIETNSKLLEIMELNYNNLMRLFQQVINIMEDENQDNPWIKKLFNIFENYSKKENFFIYNDDILSVSGKIKHNNENISLKIQNILNYYRSENNTLLMNYYVQLKTKTYEDLNYLFQNEILEIENEEGSLIASLYLKDNSIFPPVSPPYLKSPNLKKYTLVLDLNETLVNFKIKKGREGYVRLRPFLFGFLEEVSQFYELIIFTLATEAYTNSVIGAIENDKKYFDYIFYRQHAIIVGNDFVKDLTRIGRPLNSTIIIDNMPQNFRLQKENGICIQPFWGQDSNDKTLYDLMPILLDIAKNGGDVRISLNKFKDEIIGKITSNILK